MGTALESAVLAALRDPAGVLLDISRRQAEASLAAFTRDAWPIIEPGTPLRWNWHLDVLCAYVQAFYSGRIQNLIINVPPGCMKSIIFSVMGPAWCWAINPAERMLNLTNEVGLAKRDTRRLRDIVTGEWYQARWGHKVQIAHDQDQVLHFETTAKGFRQGLGMRGNITGKRGSKLGIDDPVDAKRAFSDIEIAAANDTFDQALSTRLNNPTTDGIGLIMQRLRTNDLTGHLLAKQHTKWVHVCIAMEYEGQPGYDPVRDLGPDYAHLADPRTTVGELMFPEMFPPRVIVGLKESLGEYGSAGQLQQRPTPLAGGIIKSAWWRIWPDDRKLPKILSAFTSYDTAFTTQDLKDRAYSVATTWGVWCDEQDVSDEAPEGRHKLLLLSAWWGRVDMDELLAKAKEIEAKKLKHPLDAHLIENKASGQSLIQMMRRRSKARVIAYDPAIDGGGDKDARAYYAAPLVKSGLVWAPNRPWVHDVIRMIGEYPACGALGKDVTDTFTQAINFLKNGWYLHHPDDDVDWTARSEQAARTTFDRAPDDDEMPARSGGGGYG